MYWEEKIDILKARFTPKEFRVPFSDWLEVMKKIERKFFRSERPAYRFRNWSERIMKSIPIARVPTLMIDKEISKLDNEKNYWVIVVFGDYPTAKQQLFDCGVEPIK